MKDFIRGPDYGSSIIYEIPVAVKLLDGFLELLIEAYRKFLLLAI